MYKDDRPNGNCLLLKKDYTPAPGKRMGYYKDGVQMSNYFSKTK